jgi:hypothetical protein
MGWASTASEAGRLRQNQVNKHNSSGGISARLTQLWGQTDSDHTATTGKANIYRSPLPGNLG